MRAAEANRSRPRRHRDLCRRRRVPVHGGAELAGRAAPFPRFGAGRAAQNRRVMATSLFADLRARLGSLPAREASPRPSEALLRVQRDFAQQVQDIRNTQAGLVLCAIWRAKSLQDLWHLRARVFEVVSRHFDQQQAEARLARLARHFPTRAPRSGLVPLEGATSFGVLPR